MSSTTSAGTTMAISAGTPATFNQAGFEALAFTEIGEVTTVDGNVGRTYNLVTRNPLKTRGTVKKKGSFNSGSITIPLAIDRDDAGQTIAKAALVDDDAYAFCITEPDGTKVYFQGLVTAFPTTYAGVDNILSGTITVEITTDEDGYDFVEVEAEA